MRIFYAASSTPDQSGLPGSRLWDVNLYWPLVDLGHEVVVFEADYSEVNCNLDPGVSAERAAIRRNRPRLGAALLQQVKAAHVRKPIDLFFSYFYAAHVEPDIIRQIGALGICTVNWYCNASYQFHLVADIAPAYQYCLVPERFRLDDYRRIGANPIYCQEAANPNVYKPCDVPVEYEVTFVGQKYGNRPQHIRHLIDHGVDARVWGAHWTAAPSSRPAWRRAGGRLKRLLTRRSPFEVTVPPDHCGPPLSDVELVRMYSRSAISLGFTSVADGSGIKQVRLRDFEAPMSGAFYMVEQFDELAEFFEPDKEIVFFGDRVELLDKARHYLTHEGDRRRIRDAGLRRARAEHTWHKRFEMVFKQIGIT